MGTTTSKHGAAAVHTRSGRMAKLPGDAPAFAPPPCTALPVLPVCVVFAFAAALFTFFAAALLSLFLPEPRDPA